MLAGVPGVRYLVADGRVRKSQPGSDCDRDRR